MKRPASFLALLSLVFSVLWLVFLIASMLTAGPLDTLDRVLEHVAAPGTLFYLSYWNAALVTLSVTALFAALYHCLRGVIPTGVVIGVMFIPVYSAINLFVYLSQVTIVPVLAQSLAQPESAAAARLLLSQLVQEWPASGAAFFNGLAYGILGIPSIIYGMGLYRERGLMRIGGILLALNGAACLLAVVGFLFKIDPLTIGSLVGGVLFIAALPFLAVGLRHCR